MRGKRNKCRLRKENQVNHNIFEPVPLIDYILEFVTRELFDISLKMVEYTTDCSIISDKRWVTVVCDITTKINTKPQKTNKQTNKFTQCYTGRDSGTNTTERTFNTIGHPL